MVFRNILKKVVGDPNERDIRRYRGTIDEINALEPQFKALTNEQLRAKTDEFKKRLADGEELDDVLPEAFAAVREASVRTTGMRHFDVQLIGGIVLHEGRIAEMKTGEGKTLVATLPLYLNALEGNGAHLVTPNDYLSKVGLQTMGPIYHLLGISAAVIQNAAADPSRGSFIFDPTFASDDERYQNLRPISRREAYEADITYGTNNDFGFDYLRDNMVRTLDEMVQRGHNFGIVDEVDNILIDEARTPLIISGTADKPSDYYALFARMVKNLKPSSEASIENEEPDGDYVEDLKTKTVYLTEEGVEKIERGLRNANAMQGENLYGPENSEMIPYLDNSLRAQVVYHLDKDYMVEKGQVIIVDEFTGRPMYGRRFSEGLHQAIEAKEGVQIQRENLTLATITFQNYFRMYDKLAGMTGTAMTEADEFDHIYKLDVVAIPTNVPCIREDEEDLVYMTERAKWSAVVNAIKERSQHGQPILVGTVAIETSERLSKLLDKAGVPHKVLNAKQHEREAVIIAQAGQPGAVTIATNMAGRGVDILLGGNPEGIAREKLRAQGIEITEATPDQWKQALAEAKAECAKNREIVVKAGGLHVVGTERHEARRIDNQLRGRSGRQGDPGSSQFYLSLEDDLMKRFGGDRVKGFMKTFNMPEDEPIEHSLITKSIQQAQIRVEGYNFDIRKRVLEYDDVVNKQREVIYSQRKQILEADNLREQIERMTAEEIHKLIDQYLPDDREEWELEELYRAALVLYPVPERIKPDHWERMNDEDITLDLTKGAIEVYDQVEIKLSPEIMRIAEREVMLRTIDQFWIRHLTDLDVLREGIGLVAIGQRDPLVEYKRESFVMWEAMQSQIQQRIVQTIYRVELAPQPQAAPVGVRNVREGLGNMGGMGVANARPQPVQDTAPEPSRADVWDRTGRNDPCPCGSGKKYKHCHYREIQAQRQGVPPAKADGKKRK
ncbi:MAG: preprotein translocase subunit SecA [Anaerolineae bacterium]|nr:preprotein translocase subunit SecA [Anaerolineae bacterium]